MPQNTKQHKCEFRFEIIIIYKFIVKPIWLTISVIRHIQIINLIPVLVVSDMKNCSTFECCNISAKTSRKKKLFFKSETTSIIKFNNSETCLYFILGIEKMVLNGFD